jgi:hypothetical protein
MMKQRQICERSIYDGSMDDPRMLVYWYQQRMRTQLLTEARRPWWSAYVSPLNSMVRALITPAPRRTAPTRRTTAAQAIF